MIAGAFLATLAFLLTTIAAYAATPVVTEYTVVPPQHLTVGDHVKVTIVVEADRGTTVQIAPGGIPDELALAESARFSTSNKGSGRIEVRIDLVLAPFFLGDYAMPPITLRYRDAGGASGEIQTPSSRLLVEQTLPSNVAPVPRDLKPQADLGVPPAPPYELVALAAAALALALGLLFIAWRRMQRAVPVLVALEAEPEHLGPEDAARRALDEAGVRFAADRDFAAYYRVLSSTVRGYLTDRFEFPAFALTTTELQSQMTRRGMDRWQARLVGGLLDQCDTVVYARYRPAHERADADLTAAYEIVEMTRPAEDSQEVPSTLLRTGAG